MWVKKLTLVLTMTACTQEVIVYVPSPGDALVADAVSAPDATDSAVRVDAYEMSDAAIAPDAALAPPDGDVCIGLADGVSCGIVGSNPRECVDGYCRGCGLFGSNCCVNWPTPCPRAANAVCDMRGRCVLAPDGGGGE